MSQQPGQPPPAAGPSQAPRPAPGPSPTLPVLPVDDALNFRPDLFGDDHRRLLLDMLTQSCSGFVGLLNHGLPSPTYLLESLVDFQIRNPYLRVKPVAQQIVKICILANHYRNSRDILVDLRTQLDVLYSGTLRTRILNGLLKLCRRARESGVTPEEISVHLGADDVTYGVLKQVLGKLHRIRDALGLRPTPEAEVRYSTLTAYNLLYLPPPFTTQEAVEVFAENLSNVTQRNNRPMRCMASIKRPGTRSHEDALNDLYFLVSARHLQLRHTLELQMMRLWVLEKCNRLCDDLYFCYTQVPETRQILVTLIRGLQLSRQSTSPAFRPVLYNLLQMLTQLHEAGVYLCPGYLHHAAYQLLEKIQRISDGRGGEDEDEDDEEDGEEGRRHRDPRTLPREISLDLESDPTAVQGETFFLSKNLYGNPDIFRVPDHPSRYLRRRMFVHRQDIPQIFYNIHNGEITTEIYNLRRIYSMMIEGAARQTGLTPKRFLEIMDRAPLGQEPEPELADGYDLFADVERRPMVVTSSSTSSAASSSAVASTSSASDYGTGASSSGVTFTRPTTTAAFYTSPSSRMDLERAPRQRRRMVSVEPFSPYSVAYNQHRHQRRRRRPPPPAPRGPAHTRYQGPDTERTPYRGDDDEDPRDGLAETLRNL
ncbi:tegument protein UL35 [Panine betaherpesvirus 2]|uniref:Tegument protein UL35 n=1 Tax=Panine betaherpesvirus 2 TaxID=188763 RepID=Q8QS53_9BETA|nr:tegument protein UL35 [Panine betaherpesvirus 2]AAM00676.1 tegument protein UL35 [Panine betaherpesvirus 2]QXV67789.1 tegument protein UL35 [Panine betaherpesvirus 2]